jgi:hypothetical protein
MARFDLPDVEWLVISALLPNKPRGVARVDDRRVLNADGRALGRHSGALWSAHDLRETVSIGGARRASGIGFGSCVKGLRWPDDRLVLDPRASARRQRQKKTILT